MPFDPSLPHTDSEMRSEEMRNQFTGLKTLIDAIPAGPPGNAVVISDTVVGPGGQPVVTLSAISPAYADLWLYGCARADTALGQNLMLRFNNDSGANYDVQEGITTGAANLAIEYLGQTAARVGSMTGTSALDPVAAYVFALHIPFYADVTFEKTARLSGTMKLSTLNSGLRLVNVALWWRSTAAITRIDLYPVSGSFVPGCRFRLLGVL
jgi:hypothetical protein